MQCAAKSEVEVVTAVSPAVSSLLMTIVLLGAAVKWLMRSNDILEERIETIEKTRKLRLASSKAEMRRPAVRRNEACVHKACARTIGGLRSQSSLSSPSGKRNQSSLKRSGPEQANTRQQCMSSSGQPRRMFIAGLKSDQLQRRIKILVEAAPPSRIGKCIARRGLWKQQGRPR